MSLAGMRPTQQRLAVLKALNDNAARFLDVEALHQATQGGGVAVPLATVYRILVEMEKARIAQSTKQGSRVLYRQVPDDEVAQPHFVCTRCGLAEPLGNDALMSQLFEGAGRHGFRLSPRIALVGLCSACSSKHANRL
jgi:Fur family ferric uptake transcriptional regulator